MTLQVCGEYVDEFTKFLLDNPWLAPVIIATGTLFSGGTLTAALISATALATNIATAVLQEQQMNSFRSGINEFRHSIFLDETAKYVTDRAYRCETIKVCKTLSLSLSLSLSSIDNFCVCVCVCVCEYTGAHYREQCRGLRAQRHVLQRHPGFAASGQVEPPERDGRAPVQVPCLLHPH